jgi:hypothetical protein
MQVRRKEVDEFYRSITPKGSDEDAALVMRQALAGMLWTKQYFFFDLDKWLDEHGAGPMHPENRNVRNSEWFHMVNEHIISMPDKWEYPWFAAWDLAFHAIALSTVDVDFAKQQLDLLLQKYFLHPSGQIPAYEWNFSDVNPPVYAWATLFIYRTEQARCGRGDFEFLRRSFRKLMLNFTWWVNRKDRFGKNLFEGGFLGLYYGDGFCVECPTGSGNWMDLFEVGREIANRLTRIFLRDESGRRPVFGGTAKFQTDPHWKDYPLFYEYFHGDNGAGLGASHQTGWTGLVATLIDMFGHLDAAQLLAEGRMGAFARSKQEEVREPAPVTVP